MSHELRTPLTALLVRTEMLASGDVPPYKEKDYQRSLHSDVQRLSEMVHDVLDFGRLERGRSQLHPRHVAVRSLIARAVHASRDALRLGGQRLIVDVPRHLPELWIDPEVLTRALRNLIDNATRHAPSGSAIELRAAATTQGIALVVADAGPGIGDADPRRLFEPFRTDPGTPSGSGLGLAIVDRAARAHGGHALARNHAGGGAEFRIELPGAMGVR